MNAQLKRDVIQVGAIIGILAALIFWSEWAMIRQVKAIVAAAVAATPVVAKTNFAPSKGAVKPSFNAATANPSASSAKTGVGQPQLPATPLPLDQDKDGKKLPFWMRGGNTYRQQHNLPDAP